MKKSNTKNQKNVLITTPIYYPSANPHIGHVFSTLIADVINRYYKQRGHETYFITGTDEHGSKILEAATKNNVTPQEYVDKIVERFKFLWNELKIEYDVFWRTTNPVHCERVQKIFELLHDDIYFDKWSGNYCTQCEENFNESQITYKDNKKYCRFNHPIKEVKANSYFFRMSKYKEWIKEYLESNPDFIYPAHRKNEIINTFLTSNLPDLSITREKLSWGIPVPENPDHTIYVWIDALMYYVTSLGYPDTDSELYQKFWSSPNAEVIQIMSKEIIRFHGIYWPILLHALDLPIPIKLIAHGWIVDGSNVKMSKSLSNAIDPMNWLKLVPIDAIRYYLTKEISLSEDSKCSDKMLLATYNADLVNKLGNLVSRVNTMLHKFNNGEVPKVDEEHLHNEELYLNTLKTIDLFDQNFESNDINTAVKSIVKLAENANNFIEQKKPWLLTSADKKEELDICLVLLVNAIRIIFVLLQPILVNGSKEVFKIMNFNDEVTAYENLTDLSKIYNIKVGKNDILYARLKNEINE